MCTFEITLTKYSPEIQQMKDTDLEISVDLLAIFFGLSTIFVYCLYGKIATQSFADMADCLYEFNWQTLPIGLQKYVILMMQNAQRPLHYHGSKLAVLNLETFCQVSVSL